MNERMARARKEWKLRLKSFRTNAGHAVAWTLVHASGATLTGTADDYETARVIAWRAVV